MYLPHLLLARLMASQDFDTLSKGFVKLREKHRATSSTLEGQLNVLRNENEQLATQVVALQEELRLQAEAAKNRLLALNIVCTVVLTIILHR